MRLRAQKGLVWTVPVVILVGCSNDVEPEIVSNPPVHPLSSANVVATPEQQERQRMTGVAGPQHISWIQYCNLSPLICVLERRLDESPGRLGCGL